jgi:hypothetical protein
MTIVKSKQFALVLYSIIVVLTAIYSNKLNIFLSLKGGKGIEGKVFSVHAMKVNRGVEV